MTTQHLARQAAFDKSVRGIVAQGGPAVNVDGNCAYRVKDRSGAERRCGLGHLIPDSAYNPSMEGKGPEIMLRFAREADPTFMRELDVETATLHSSTQMFLDTLQTAHDEPVSSGEACVVAGMFAPASPRYWRSYRAALADMVKTYNLDASVLNEIPS